MLGPFRASYRDTSAFGVVVTALRSPIVSVTTVQERGGSPTSDETNGVVKRSFWLPHRRGLIIIFT